MRWRAALVEIATSTTLCNSRQGMRRATRFALSRADATDRRLSRLLGDCDLDLDRDRERLRWRRLGLRLRLRLGLRLRLRLRFGLRLGLRLRLRLRPTCAVGRPCFVRRPSRFILPHNANKERKNSAYGWAHIPPQLVSHTCTRTRRSL